MQHSIFTKWDVYNEGSIPLDRFKFSHIRATAYSGHFAAAGLVLFNTDRSASQSFKSLKFVWEKNTGMKFESCLQQFHKSVLEPLLAKWSTDEERWLRDNCKAFAALKAPAPSTASAVPASTSPAPASADAGPAPYSTGPSEEGRCGKQASSSSSGHCGH